MERSCVCDETRTGADRQRWRRSRSVQRPAGIAGVGRRVELDQVADFLLTLRRLEGAAKPRNDAVRDGRPDAERETHGHHMIAGHEIAGGAHGGGNQVVGDGVGLQHGQVVVRLHPGHRGAGFAAIGKHQLDALRALHHVQVGQDDALVDNHHARAHALLHFFALLVLAVGHDAHHGGAHLLGRARRRRGDVLGGEGAQHRCVDVFLRQCPGPVLLPDAGRQQRGQQRHACPQGARATGCDHRRLAPAPQAPGRRGGHRRRLHLCRRIRLRTRASAGRAVHGRFSHGGS
jgi:hypothetical protein